MIWKRMANVFVPVDAVFLGNTASVASFSYHSDGYAITLPKIIIGTIMSNIWSNFCFVKISRVS